MHTQTMNQQCADSERRLNVARLILIQALRP